MIGWTHKPWSKFVSLSIAFLYSSTLFVVYPQTVDPAYRIKTGQDRFIEVNFINSPLEQVLEWYSRITEKTLIKAPDVPSVQISIETYGKLSETEGLIAVEAALAMHNIAFVPFGEKFLKVVQASKPLNEGQEVRTPLDERELKEDSDNVITKVVELQHLSIQEAQPVVQNMIHSYGKINPLERNNALMITDTEATISQIKDVLSYVDTPIEIREEPRIYEIRYAQASEIAGRLNEIISQSQQNQQQSGNNTPTARTARQRTIDSLRRRAAQNNNNNNTPAAGSAAALAEKGIIQGKVQIVSDERTNILIIISDPVNFAFFDKIVAVLDRQVEPELTVKIIPLEFAEASEIAGVLNDLIGAANEGDEGANPNSDTATSGDGQSTSLRDFINRRRQIAQQAENDTGEGKSALNQLSENTRILADERTNALIIMGKKADISVLEDVLGQLDVMLAQVLIEAVIIEVGLNDDIQYGFDWLQRSLTVVDQRTRGARGGISVNEPVYAFGGGQRVSGSGDFIDGSTVGRDIPLSAGGLTYFATFFDFNIDAIVNLTGSSSDARVLSSPVILTTDNTEAEITVGEQRPIPTSSSTTIGGVIRSTYEYRDIGINLSVTPRINPNQMVTMEISQSADNVGGNISIDGNEVPVITRRELQGTITVSNRTTIALGGLVSEDARDTITKVPWFGDLPIIGNLFRDTAKNNNRSEIIVLLTPYVLISAKDAARETRRLHDATRGSDKTWYRGWSDSPLADLPEEEEVRTPLFSYREKKVEPPRVRNTDEFDRPVLLKPDTPQEFKRTTEVTFRPGDDRANAMQQKEDTFRQEQEGFSRPPLQRPAPSQPRNNSEERGLDNAEVFEPLFNDAQDASSPSRNPNNIREENLNRTRPTPATSSPALENEDAAPPTNEQQIEEIEQKLLRLLERPQTSTSPQLQPEETVQQNLSVDNTDQVLESARVESEETVEEIAQQAQTDASTQVQSEEPFQQASQAEESLDPVKESLPAETEDLDAIEERLAGLLGRTPSQEPPTPSVEEPVQQNTTVELEDQASQPVTEVTDEADTIDQKLARLIEQTQDERRTKVNDQRDVTEDERMVEPEVSIYDRPILYKKEDIASSEKDEQPEKAATPTLNSEENKGVASQSVSGAKEREVVVLEQIERPAEKEKKQRRGLFGWLFGSDDKSAEEAQANEMDTQAEKPRIRNEATPSVPSELSFDEENSAAPPLK